MRPALLASLILCATALGASAQTLQDILQTHAEEIAKPSRNSVGIALTDLAASGLPQTTNFLEKWAEKNVWQRADGVFFIGTKTDDELSLTDIDTDAKSNAPTDGFTATQTQRRRAEIDRNGARSIPTA